MGLVAASQRLGQTTQAYVRIDLHNAQRILEPDLATHLFGYNPYLPGYHILKAA